MRKQSCGKMKGFEHAWAQCWEELEPGLQLRSVWLPKTLLFSLPHRISRAAPSHLFYSNVGLPPPLIPPPQKTRFASLCSCQGRSESLLMGSQITFSVLRDLRLPGQTSQPSGESEAHPSHSQIGLLPRMTGVCLPGHRKEPRQLPLVIQPLVPQQLQGFQMQENSRVWHSSLGI